MPVYTVVGKLTADESWFLPTGCYRGRREDLVPPGGWGHILTASSPTAARHRAVHWYASYAAGRAVFKLEIRQQGTDGPPARQRRSWWPWGRRKEQPPEAESLGFFPIV